MVRNALTKTGKWILYLLAAIVILIALLAASVRLAVFYSKDYSEELASLVSSYVGSPVEIGEVDLVWNRFDANASLKDVQIRTADDSATLLELPQIELQLNVRDILLERKLSVRSVQLSNLSLAASYEGRGQLRMLGKVVTTDRRMGSQPSSGAASPVKTSPKIQTDGSSGTSVLSWLFNAERISILDSDITLVDATRDRKYEIDNINIRAFNDNDLHQIRVTSALPGNIGDNSIASFDFIGSADDINAWKGQFYVDAAGLNIDQVSEFWRQPSENYSGTTDLQVWGKWSGTRVNEIRAIASARDVELQQHSLTGKEDSSLRVDSLDVDADWARTDAGWQLNFGRLAAAIAGSAATADRVVLDGLDLHVERNADGNKELRAAGPDFNLQTLQPVLSYIDATTPDSSAYPLQLLRRGEIKDWFLGGVWLPQGFQLTELTSNINNLAVDSYESQPGFSDLSASVFYRDGVGHLDIDNQDISLSLPALYEKALPVINADGIVKFLVNQNVSDHVASVENTLTDESAVVNVNAVSVEDTTAVASEDSPEQVWKVVSEDLRLSSLDLNTSATFTLQGMKDGQLLVDLHTNILNANLSRIQDYYPTRVMKPKLLNWLQTAIQGGDVVRGRLELKGDLTNFAPARGIGHFYAESDVVDARVKFRPDWPAVESMDGNVSLTANAMRGRVYQGKIREAKFSDARLYLPQFKRPVLELTTNAIGPLADMLDFAQTGPLASKIGALFGDASGSGVSRLALDLKLPLNKKLRDELSVDGELMLDSAQLTAQQFGVDLESATGKVSFTKSGVAIDDLQVRYQGIPLEVKAGYVPGTDKKINRLSINGPVSVASVMRSYGIPLVEQFDGLSDWAINVDIERRVGKKPLVSFVATSDLSGTEMKFPIPLNKSADSLNEIRVTRDFSATEKDWWVEMPGLAKARIRVGADKKLESMAVAFGKSNNTVLPWRGMALHGDTQRLDARGWINFALGFQSDKETTGEAFPVFAKINARQLMVGKGNNTDSEALGELVYIAYRDGDHQVHRVENPLISGELRVGGSKATGEPLVAQLDRLDKRLFTAIAAAQAADTANEVTNQKYDPRELRPLDVTVKELKWDDWRFSRISLRTLPTDSGLEITALTARQNSLRISGSGHWDYLDGFGNAGSHTTRLDLNASFDNFGRAISTMGGGQSFAAGTGEAALSLTWPSPAFAPDLQSMAGQLLFSLRDGRILTVEPGAGRVLGLFALQALPRRLAFDFRDITNKGLEYTNISGNLSIANGQAQTNAIVMTGPVAEILVRGATDIVAQTYDQTIDVLPRVSGALPLLGVLSGGPVAGLTALLADGVLRGIGVNLDEIGRQRYTLTGDWDVPVWKTVSQVNSRR